MDTKSINKPKKLFVLALVSFAFLFFNMCTRERERERERETQRERRGAFRPFYNSIEFVDYIIQNQTLLS